MATLGKKKTDSKTAVAKTTTKIRASTLRKAKALAAIRGKDLFEYLDSVLTPMMEKEYALHVRE